VNITKNKLSVLVGEKAVLILRDVYIHKIDKSILPDKYSVTPDEVSNIIAKIKRILIYELRELNYRVTPKCAIFKNETLVKWVWQDFLDEEIEGGKTTLQIANKLGLELGVVNSYR